MTREEASKIVDKVQVHRQSFLITNAVYLEWFRILEPYDYEDVDAKLDEYFKNSENFGKYPDAYYLIKYLKKQSEKLQSGHIYVRCQLCKQTVDLAKYDQHFDRCSSADYLCKMSLEKYDKKLKHENMINADKKQFDDYYWNFCEKVIDDIEDVRQKHSLKNAILTHSGFEPELDLDEIMKEATR